jgi:hypothetical protein
VVDGGDDLLWGRSRTRTRDSDRRSTGCGVLRWDRAVERLSATERRPRWMLYVAVTARTVLSGAQLPYAYDSTE